VAEGPDSTLRHLRDNCEQIKNKRSNFDLHRAAEIRNKRFRECDEMARKDYETMALSSSHKPNIDAKPNINYSPRYSLAECRRNADMEYR
jgi:hypothetical protein